MTLGQFAAGAFRFEVDDGFSVVDLGEAEEICDEELDLQITRSGRVPQELGQAPLASWVLARLHCLLGGSLGLPTGTIEVIDGGVYVIDFLVSKEGIFVAKVQLQAGMIGAGLLGMARRGQAGADIVDALISALVSEPDRFSICEVLIQDPEWHQDPSAYVPSPDSESKNRFGWDGDGYLGADNVRPR